MLISYIDIKEVKDARIIEPIKHLGFNANVGKKIKNNLLLDPQQFTMLAAEVVRVTDEASAMMLQQFVGGILSNYNYIYLVDEHKNDQEESPGQ